jgi:hypothetical protein
MGRSSILKRNHTDHPDAVFQPAVQGALERMTSQKSPLRNAEKPLQLNFFTLILGHKYGLAVSVPKGLIERKGFLKISDPGRAS